MQCRPAKTWFRTMTVERENRIETTDYKAYRAWLTQAEHQASRDFDKAVMTLSAGALGLTIAFIHDIAPEPAASSIRWLGVGWALLVISLVAILASFLTSQHDLRRAVRDVDEGTISPEQPGGSFYVTLALNLVAAGGFVLGVIFLGIFALLNVESLS